MEQYIRDFNFPAFETYYLTNLSQCNQVFEMNELNDNFTISIIIFEIFQKIWVS